MRGVATFTFLAFLLTCCGQVTGHPSGALRVWILTSSLAELAPTLVHAFAPGHARAVRAVSFLQTLDRADVQRP